MKESSIDLVSVHNNWKDDVLNIDLSLGNYCNYKCWYCFPGANDGTHKYPDIKIIKNNIEHFINHYIKNGNKKVFDIHFCGGEPTHWKNLPEFSKFLKENFNCLLSMTSNGSKKIEWWKENAKYFDRIQLSCHHEFVNIKEFRDLCDYLYEQNVVVSVSAMMDPNAWNKCMDNVEYLKKSKHKWTIRYVELIDSELNKIQYTEEQRNILSKHRARQVSLWFFLKNNKYYRSSITAIDSLGKKYKLQDNEILLKRLNSFYGWSCSLGVNWVNVSVSGNISGTCFQLLYGEDFFYNLYDSDFKEKFNPVIKPTICKKTNCWCAIETVMPKNKIENKKVIPIYEN